MCGDSALQQKRRAPPAPWGYTAVTPRVTNRASQRLLLTCLRLVATRISLSAMLTRIGWRNQTAADRLEPSFPDA